MVKDRSWAAGAETTETVRGRVYGAVCRLFRRAVGERGWKMQWLGSRGQTAELQTGLGEGTRKTTSGRSTTT